MLASLVRSVHRLAHSLRSLPHGTVEILECVHAENAFNGKKRSLSSVETRQRERFHRNPLEFLMCIPSTPHDNQYVSLFSRVHATLYLTSLVGPSIGPPVGRSVGLRLGVFKVFVLTAPALNVQVTSKTAPTHLRETRVAIYTALFHFHHHHSMSMAPIGSQISDLIHPI